MTPRKLVLSGDVILYGRPAEYIEKAGGLYHESIDQTISNSDVFFANLELPFCNDCISESLTPALPVPEELARFLPALQFDVVSLANNHILDWGKTGLQKTIKLLDDAGVFHTGAGMTEEEARAPVIVEKNGCRYGFLAYAKMESVSAKKLGYGVAELNLDDVLADIARLRDQVNILIVSIHWGVVFNPNPSPSDVKLAYQLIDNGVDIIAGHHPHVYQKVERYKNGVIAYSLGNFIADLKFSFSNGKPVNNSALTIMLEIDIDATLTPNIIPIVQMSTGQLRNASVDERETVLMEMRTLHENDIDSEFYGHAMESAFSVEIERIIQLILRGNFSRLRKKLSTIKLKHFGYLYRVLIRKLGLERRTR